MKERLLNFGIKREKIKIMYEQIKKIFIEGDNVPQKIKELLDHELMKEFRIGFFTGVVTTLVVGFISYLLK